MTSLLEESKTRLRHAMGSMPFDSTQRQVVEKGIENMTLDEVQTTLADLEELRKLLAKVSLGAPRHMARLRRAIRRRELNIRVVK